MNTFLKNRLSWWSLAAIMLAAHAEAATTFTSTVTNANGELSTTLSWTSDRASCEASGHEAWSGPKPASGSETLPTITLSGSYTLTLTCVSPADDDAELTWVPPTENTDGSPLTNLASYRIYWGMTPGSYPNSELVEGANVTSRTIDGRDRGTSSSRRSTALGSRASSPTWLVSSSRTRSVTRRA